MPAYTRALISKYDEKMELLTSKKHKKQLQPLSKNY